MLDLITVKERMEAAENLSRPNLSDSEMDMMAEAIEYHLAEDIPESIRIFAETLKRELIERFMEPVTFLEVFSR